MGSGSMSDEARRKRVRLFAITTISRIVFGYISNGQTIRMVLLGYPCFIEHVRIQTNVKYTFAPFCGTHFGIAFRFQWSQV